MASTSVDAVRLLKELDSEKIEETFVKLQKEYEESLLLNKTNHATIQKLEQENSTFKSQVEKLEKMNKTVSDQLAVEKEEKSRLRLLNSNIQNASKVDKDLIANLEEKSKMDHSKFNKIEQLYRKALSDLQRFQESCDLNLKELELARIEIGSLKNRNSELFNKVKTTREENSIERHESSQKIAKLESERSKHQSQIAILESNNSMLQEKNNDLSKTLNQNIQEKEQLNLQVSTLRAAYDKVNQRFTDSSQESSSRWSSIQAELATAKKEIDLLVAQLNQAKAQNEEEQALRKTYFNSFIDKNASSSVDNLTKLISKYTENNRHPQDVFNDYFQLKQAYERAVADNKENAGIIEQWRRQLDDKNNLLSRLHCELQERQREISLLQKNLENKTQDYTTLNDSNNSNVLMVKKLEGEVSDLQSTISDLNYQLQYVLCDIARRSEPIPIQAQDTFELLRDTRIVPRLSHQELCFRNVNEIQDKNLNLTVELRRSRKIVETLKSECENVKVAQKALEENKVIIDSLQSQITELKTKNVSLENEVKAVKASETVSAIYKNQALIEEDYEMTFDEFRKEALLDAEKMATELSDTRQQLSVLRAESSNWLIEKNSMQLDVSQRKYQVDVLQAELNRVNTSLEKRLAEIGQLEQQVHDLQVLVDETNNEVNSWKLTSDRDKINLSHTKEAYEEMKMLLSKKSTDYESLLSAFNQLSDRLDKLNDSKLLNARIQSLIEEIEEKKSLLTEKETQITRLELTAKFDKEAALNELQAELRVLKKQLSEVQDNLVKVSTEKALVESQLSTLKSKANDGNAADDGATSCEAHTALIEEYEQKLGELEKVNFAYHEQTEELEGKIDQLLSQVSTNDEKADTFCKELQKNLEEEIEKSKKLQELNEQMAKDYKVSKDQLVKKEQEFNSEKASFDEKIVSLNNDIVKANDAISEFTAKLEQQEFDLGSARKNLEDEKKMNLELSNTITELNIKVTELNSEVEKAKNDLDAVNQMKSVLQVQYDESIEYHQKMKNDYQAEIDKYNVHNAELNNQIQQLVTKIMSFSESEDDISDVAKQASDEALDQLRRTNDFLRAQKDMAEKNYMAEQHQHRLTALQIESYKQQLALLQADINALNSQKDMLIEKVHNNSTDDKSFNEALKIQNVNLIKENEKLKNVNFNSTSAQEKLEVTIKQLNFKVSTLEKALECAKEEVNTLTKSNEEWSNRANTLLSKYHKIDPKEMDNLKTDLSTTKQELAALKSDKEALDTQMKTILSEKTKLEEDKSSLIKKCNERGRMCMDLRKQVQELEQKKENDSTDKLQALVKEKEELETKLKEMEAAKATVEGEIKSKDDAKQVLDRKYNLLLQRARNIQLDNKRLTKEMEELKSSSTNDSADKSAKLELEKELATIKKQLNESTLEITRYRAQTSMAQNKTAKLQKEVDALKAKIAEGAEDAEGNKKDTQKVESESHSQPKENTNVKLNNDANPTEAVAEVTVVPAATTPVELSVEQATTANPEVLAEPVIDSTKESETANAAESTTKPATESSLPTGESTASSSVQRPLEPTSVPATLGSSTEQPASSILDANAGETGTEEITSEDGEITTSPSKRKHDDEEVDVAKKVKSL